MRIQDEFFEWMYQLIAGKGYSDCLKVLYDKEFYAIMQLDDNRLMDGCEVRYRFADECNIPRSVIDRQFDRTKCSVLEMMVGLAIRIEESMMADEDFGDRTSMWFWIMMKSLGLNEMRNDRIRNEFDTLDTIGIIDNFLNRGYKSNGEGGLFTVNDTSKDMRDLDIWYQMCMFFDNIL